MRAAVYHAAGEIRVEQVDEPALIGPRELLIRPVLCGICGTDLHEYVAGPIVIPTEPHALTGASAPQTLGHEFSAVVVEVGAEVVAAAPGDRVSVMPLIVCGRCRFCVQGLNHLCTAMACTGLSSAWGGMAELAVVADYQVAVLPDTVSDVQGALIEPSAVAAYGVDRSQVRPGETLLITGAGPIGALAALYGVASGFSVIVAERNPRRAELARALEVGPVFDPGDPALTEHIERVTGGLGVHGSVECAGNASALNACIELTRSRGTVVQTGLHVGPAEIMPMTLSLKDLSLVGTWCYPITDWPRMIELLGTGRFPVERVVTAEIGIDHVVDQGFEPLIDPKGQDIKILVGTGSER